MELMKPIDGKVIKCKYKVKETGNISTSTDLFYEDFGEWLVRQYSKGAIEIINIWEE